MNGKWLRLTVLAVGGVLFILLLFADKTNLTNRQEAFIGRQGSGGTSSTPEAKLPPLASDPKLDNWISQLEEVSEADKATLLDSIISVLQSRGRYAYAANYAVERYELAPSPLQARKVGELSLQAQELEYIIADSLMARKYSDQGLRFMKEAVEANPDDPDLLLRLGVGYVRSGKVENSMLGIQTIRQVLSIDPDHVGASFQLGMFSMQTQQFEKAEARFTKVLSLEPRNYAAMFQLALAHAQQNERVEAKEYLEKLLEANDADALLKVEARKLLQNL